MGFKEGYRAVREFAETLGLLFADQQLLKQEETT